MRVQSHNASLGRLLHGLKVLLPLTVRRNLPPRKRVSLWSWCLLITPDTSKPACRCRRGELKSRCLQQHDVDTDSRGSFSLRRPLLHRLRFDRRPLVGLVAVSQDSMMAEEASSEGAINICREYRRFVSVSL